MHNRTWKTTTEDTEGVVFMSEVTETNFQEVSVASGQYREVSVASVVHMTDCRDTCSALKRSIGRRDEPD